MLKVKKKSAQISLELGLAFVVIFLLLLGAVSLSVWLVGRIVVRQEDYEYSRMVATDPRPGGRLGVEVNEAVSPRYPRLRFFGN